MCSGMLDYGLLLLVGPVANQRHHDRPKSLGVYGVRWRR